MEFIPSNETLLMKHIEPDVKSFKITTLKGNIVINSLTIYSYVLSMLKNNNIDETYHLLYEIKTVLRYIWKTLSRNSKGPDVDYINNINKTTKIVTNLFITPVTKTINSKTKDTSVNNEFIYFMYSFVPCFNYYNIVNDTLWDNQLFVFKNIVQSKNIKIRYDIKEINKMKIKECKNNYGNDVEKIDIIMEDYRNTIERLKNDTIFKLVNYLN